MDKTQAVAGIAKLLAGIGAALLGSGVVHASPEWLAFLVAVMGIFGGANNVKQSVTNQP